MSKRAPGSAIVFAHPGFREFLQAFIADAHPKTETDLYMLCADGEPMAAILFFRWGDAMLYYQSGWDPSSAGARMSPNLVLFGRSIRDAIAEGVRYFEFLRGDEPFKGKFTSRARPTKTLLVSGEGMKSRLYLLTMGMKDRAKSALGGRPLTVRRS